MNKCVLRLFLFLGMLLGINTEEGWCQTQKRLALVIGNANYPGSSVLKNPVNDAVLMTNTLRSLGFEVISTNNATKQVMESSIRRFSEKLSQTKVALFYYAGHGMQVDGKNYLIPIDAKLDKKGDCKYEAIPINFIVEEFEQYPDNVNIVILDACRNDPFRSWGRSSANRGFKAVLPLAGTIIAFATSEGSTASDGTGENGTFTEALVKQMKKYQPIETVFKSTRIEVMNKTNKQQVPQDWSQLTGEFYFTETATKTTFTKTNEPTIAIVEEDLSTYGSIEITSKINGDIYIDREYVKKATADTKITIKNIKTGKHSIEIKTDDNKTLTEEVTIIENETISITTGEAESKPLDLPIAGEMVYIPEGTFQMGSNDGEKDEKPLHSVTISAFYIMKYEVTQGLWTEIMEENPSSFNECYQCPVEQVSWDDIQIFIKKLNTRTGKRFRLPTEAEWEYAAKGGENYTYAGSNNINEVAWYRGNSERTHHVGQKKPNGYGLYDMTGNVWEWCQDCYNSSYYASSPAINPVSPSDSFLKCTFVLRGGSWNRKDENCRSSNRDGNYSESRDYNYGFRLVLVP
ncbi:MAG: SUMF1/EgtB/PvdO family nonheme iron enzyme [Chitinophagaceae bacterium]|nr:SUMF1/EgtB/PvdO family nonheme iron enzyme [Chitinophagaceae bacterium]